MKLFLYCEYSTWDNTDNYAAFSEDCKGSVWKSWKGGDDVDNV